MKIASGRGRKNHCQGMGWVWEENFLLFCKNREKCKIFMYFLHFHSKVYKSSTFLSSRKGEALENIHFFGGGSKIFSGRGTVFFGVSLWESPPLPPPLAHLW